MEYIYLDNVRAARVDERALQEMMPYFTEKFGVPGGEFGHAYEEEAAEAVERARETIARSLGVHPSEIVFTSSPEESNNLGVIGYALANGKGKVVASRIESSCVLESVKYLSEHGYPSRVLGVDREGFVDTEALKKHASGATLIAIQRSNGEIGTVQDTHAASDIAEDAGSGYHMDMRYSYLQERIDLGRMHVTTATIASNLVHGPLGIAALYVREGVRLRPLLRGTYHEGDIRPGVVPTALAVGFGAAVREWMRERDAIVTRMRRYRDSLMKGLLEIEDTELNGAAGDRRIPGNVNVSFKGAEGEAILLMANERGIIARTGSACYSRSLKPSYVIRALGKTYEVSHGSVLFSIGKYNDPSEVPRVVEVMSSVVEKLRGLNPFRREVR